MKELLVNDLWEELRIEQVDMELQHLCFEFLEELRPGVICQGNYSPRVTCSTGISILPCLSLSSGTANLPKTPQNGLRPG